MEFFLDIVSFILLFSLFLGNSKCFTCINIVVVTVVVIDFVVIVIIVVIILLYVVWYTSIFMYVHFIRGNYKNLIQHSNYARIQSHISIMVDLPNSCFN